MSDSHETLFCAPNGASSVLQTTYLGRGFSVLQRAIKINSSKSDITEMAQILLESHVTTIGESRSGGARLVALAVEARNLDMATWLVKNGATIDDGW